MRDFKIRTVMLLLVLIGCLGLIVTNFRPIADAVSERTSAVEHAATVERMKFIQDAMNAVQRERGLSVVHIVSGAAAPSAALLTQRTETDALVAELFVTFTQDVGLQAALRDLQTATSRIDALRTRINAGSVDDVDVIDSYSGVVEHMISVVAQATTLNAGNADTQSASALVVLMRARDLAGLERAYGSALLATGFSQPKHLSGFRKVSYGHQMALGLVGDLSLGALSGPISDLRASDLQAEMDQRRAQFISSDTRLIGQITVAGWLDLTTRYIEELSAIEVGVLDTLSSDTRAAGAEATRFLVLTTIVSCLILAGMVGVSLALYRTIKTRLSGALAAMDALAEGNLDTPVPPVSDSEMGRICAGLATFKEVLVAQETLKQQAVGKEQAQREVVETMQAALAKLASGDLKMTLQSPFPEQYEPLRLNYNEAVQRLSMALGNLLTTTDDIHEGAAEMSQSARDLAARTETQAATLEQTAAALDELTASVKSAADGAGRANDVVSQAHGEAQRSGEVVTAAVESMGAISASSREISQIIGVIQDIAFQTNLLALNAGVEAARAGDAGRGFAVVASEVRALAQRSSEAAKEIRDLIGQSSKHVNRGVDMVGQAGAALTLIVGRVSEISSLVSDLAASSKEQALGLSEINTGVNQLDQVTQQNAAMVEESTAAALTLSTHAEMMKKSMGEFTILQSFDALPTKPKPVRSQAAQRPDVPAPSRSQKHHAIAATAWAAQDDLDEDALSIEDNWDEF